MLPGRKVSRFGYILRALIAMALIAAFSLWMVARSTGITSNDPKVFAEIPVAAGVIQGGAPVRYNGIKVGEISSIDAGTESSRVGLTIDKDSLGKIPANVEVRVLPRTFFGDIYLKLAPRPDTKPSTVSLKADQTVAVDTSDEAINLYNIFTKLSGLIDEVRPDQLQVALAAVDRAIGGRGDMLGEMIDDWAEASKILESSLVDFIESTPQFLEVAESLQRATPAMLDTLESVSSISRGIVEHAQQIGAFLSSASGYVGEVGEFVAEHKKNIITVVDATGTIASTVADNPEGITRTLREANKFGETGAIIFKTGKFDITAVPTFAQPMPYTARDCPTYGELRGAQCTGTTSELGVGPPREPGQENGTVIKPNRRGASTTEKDVIDGRAEASTLSDLEGRVRGTDSQADKPNAATTMMLGPMVRGAEVTVK